MGYKIWFSSLGYGGIVMNKKIFLKAILDGFIQSFCLICLVIIIVSEYSPSTNPTYLRLLVMFGAGSVGFVYFLLIRKESSNKAIIYLTLTSILFFVLWLIIMIILYTIIPTDFLTALHEANIADGILTVIVSRLFLLYSFVLKVCVLIALVIKNHRKCKK